MHFRTPPPPCRRRSQKKSHTQHFFLANYTCVTYKHTYGYNVPGPHRVWPPQNPYRPSAAHREQCVRNVPALARPEAPHHHPGRNVHRLAFRRPSRAAAACDPASKSRPGTRRRTTPCRRHTARRSLAETAPAARAQRLQIRTHHPGARAASRMAAPHTPPPPGAHSTAPSEIQKMRHFRPSANPRPICSDIGTKSALTAPPQPTGPPDPQPSAHR